MKDFYCHEKVASAGHNTLFSKHLFPDIVKSGIFAVILQFLQQSFQQSLCSGVEQQPTPLSAQKKLIGIARGKGISAVDLAGRQAVTEHFRHIFFRHFHADDSAAIQTVVCPKFKVMAVAALMMHPGGAIAFCLSLGVIGAVITLKVFGTSPKRCV